jgi:RND family efflux transporter MFP subunit
MKRQWTGTLQSAVATALLVVPLSAPLAQTTSEEIEVVEETVATNALPAMDCIVQPSEVVELGTSVSGILEELNADRNSFVSEGEVVARLESSVEQATLELATARADLETTLQLRKENAAFGKRTQKRNQKLFKDSTISAYDMDRVKTETYIAELQAKQEEDNQRIARLEAARAHEALEQRTLRSPINGVIMERYKSIGEYIEAEPVFKIAQLDPLHVELIVPIDHFGAIARGMQAEIHPEVAPDGLDRQVATVVSVDRVADAASGTFSVQLSLPNAGYRIPSGVRCNLEFLPQELASTEQ